MGKLKMFKSDSKPSSKQSYDEKEMLKLIISALNTGLVLLDPDMTVVWANDITKEWFSDPNLQGKKCFAVAENRTTPCDDCQAVAAFEDGEIHVREFQNIEPPKRWFKVVALPIKNQEDRPTRSLMRSWPLLIPSTNLSNTKLTI